MNIVKSRKRPTRLNVAVIGLGMGKAHLAAFSGYERSDVVAICDKDSARLSPLAEQFGIAKDRCFRDHRQMLARAGELDLHAVSIALPNVLHAPVTTDCFKAGLHSSDITMMVRTENVDQVIVVPLPLSVVIGNVGGEVSLLAIVTNDNAVLFISVVRRTKPRGAVFLIEHAPLFQHGQCIVNQVVLGQALLGEPAVKGDTKFSKIILDVIENGLE